VEIPGEWPQAHTEDKKPEAIKPASEAVAPETKPDTSPPKPVQEDKYEIKLNSYKVIDIFGKVAIHNEVAFYRNGEPMMAVNGYAHNSQKGGHSTTALSPGNTLRATISDTLHDGKMVSSISLGTMDREAMIEKMKTVVSASQFINANKIEYVAMGGPHFEAQNSNSIATSLLTAMGYQYPDKALAQFWDPGSKRPLLPNDWKREDMSVADMMNMRNNLNGQAVAAQIKSEKNPYPIFDPEANSFPTLFKPEETSVQYAKNNNQTTATVTARSGTGFQSAAGVMIETDHSLTSAFASAVHAVPAEVRLVAQPSMAVASNADVYRSYGTSGP
jgi:hypothetical protein